MLHWELFYFFTERKLLLNSIQEKKMIGHRTRLQENDDLPIWQAWAIKKKLAFCNVCMLITREIMHRKDAQCNTKEWP